MPSPEQLHKAARAVLAALDETGSKVSTAESCTGGYLASLLTDIEGLSHAFDRGFVTYSDNAKQQMLGIEAEKIKRCGAVSETIARVMAEASLARSRAVLALAITGFAGPADPASPEGPGVVFVAAAIPLQSWVYRIDYGERPRHEVRNLASLAALKAGRRALTWRDRL